MTNRNLYDLPATELQESDITLQEIRQKASSAKKMSESITDRSTLNYENTDIILCLANKIHELEQEINKLKHE